MFTSARAGHEDLWIALVAGGALRQLTDDAAGDWVPVFSPDGQTIYFASDRANGDSEIYSIPVGGGQLINLTDHPSHWDGQWSLAVAPDGSRIAYGTGTYPDAATSGWVREDFAAAESILFAVVLAALALVVIALGAPLLSFALTLGIVVGVATLTTEAWAFLPAGIAAGALVDLLYRGLPERWRRRGATAAFAGLGVLGVGLTIGLSGALAWSGTLLSGVTLVAAAIGWGLATLVESVGPRDEMEAAAEPAR